MKNFDLTPYRLLPATTRRTVGLFDRHDADKLARFYFGFDGNGRRERFCAAVSNASILRYCREIDWRRTIVVARTAAYLPDAVLEVHALSDDWRHAEIVVACPLRCDRMPIFAQLLQLAALAAGARGCTAFTLDLEGCDRDVLRLLAAMGQLHIDGATASVDIGEYALVATRDAGFEGE